MSATQLVSAADKGTQACNKRPRSAVTSGRKFFVTGDPNSAWARRFHDLVVGHIADTGGRDMLSEAQLALCKRAAALECECVQLEGRLSQGEQIDLDRYGRAASHLRRLLESVGLERKPRSVTRTVDEYARQMSRGVRMTAATATTAAAKACQSCGTPLLGQRADALFCSNACRIRIG
jgi:hypothetical protein